MKVLVINAGSSSLKYQLLDMDTEKVLAKGLAERIGIDGSNVSYQPAEGEKIVVEEPLKDHKDALDIIIEKLTDPKVGVIENIEEIDAVGHRTVHGGEEFAHSVLIDDAVIKTLEEVSELAPLHNPANLTGIRAMEEILPDVPQVAVFDTAFHQTMPEESYLYAIPYEYYEKYKVRRYGFHGTSHDFVSKHAAELVGKDRKDLKIIVCHLGNGASISAVRNGECVDTSMGMTPLEGLIMGTRSGDIDPAIIEYICNKEGLTVEEVNAVLNKKSGVLGLSNHLSSDFRDLDEAAQGGNEYAKLALDTYCYRVAKYIGAYAMAMQGVDIIAFTAGCGENNYAVRAGVCEYLKYLGVVVNDEKLHIRGEDLIVSEPESSVTVMIVPTNEELSIARQTMEVIK